jgi:hypothetical protein
LASATNGSKEVFMRQKLRSRLTFANVVSVIALFFALGGAATIAATSVCTGGLPCVNSDDIINGEVKNPDIGGNAVGTGKVLDDNLQGSDIKDATLTGADIGNNTLLSADLANGAVTPAKFGTIPAARATKTTVQSIPTAQATALTFDDEDFDTGRPFGLHSPTTNNTRLTAPISGVYQVSAGVGWDDNDTGNRILGLRLNGGACCPSAASFMLAATSGFETRQNVSDMLKLSAGDFIEAMAEQTSGGNLSAVNSIGSTFFAMAWIGPG